MLHLHGLKLEAARQLHLDTGRQGKVCLDETLEPTALHFYVHSKKTSVNYLSVW